MKNSLLILLALLLPMIGVAAQSKPEFTHPQLLSFEGSAQGFTPSDGSTLTLSSDHYKHGRQSLRWSWSKSQTSIVLSNQQIHWTADPKDQPDPSTYTTVFWLYNLSPMPGAKLRFEYLKDGQLASWFDYGLDFKGWRGAWIAFERDMQGTPVDGMDQLRITVYGASEGSLFLDHLILSSLQDLRQHTADTQAPFINAQSKSHWLQGVHSTRCKMDLAVPSKLTSSERKSVDQLIERYELFALDGVRPSNIDTLKSRFNSFEIKTNSDGTLRGRPLFFNRFGETYFSLGFPRDLNLYAQSVKTLTDANRLLLQLAITYRLTQGERNQQLAKEMYMTFTRYMLDQGMSYGSSLGTLHHLGYSLKEFFTAFLLMKKELYQEGLGSEVAQAMEWFSMAGEVKPKPTTPGFDIDTFNTFVMPRLASILMMEASPEQYAYLQSYLRWLNNGFETAPGLDPSFKSDGSVYHHCNNYPAYARDGMRGATEAVYVLSGTPFAVSAKSHQQLKEALLTMRFYCNLTQWPISMSGRHPAGDQGLQPRQYALMALAGTPGGKAKIDREMVAAYLRLYDGEKNKYSLLFEGDEPEASPEGNLSLPYACVMIHRRNNWSLSVRGFSRYLWNSETYENANLFGRYLAFGNMQIQAMGDPVSNEASGYVQKGWNWNHWWGTTTTVLPIEQLKSVVLNVDAYSGNEEMLLSDEAFAGSVSLEKRNGLYAMKLHDHDKYGGTLRARKSYFFFDHRVVCLGSDVESKDSLHSTVTTLFQEYIPPRGNQIEVDGNSVKSLPFEWQKRGNSSLVDAQGNAYFVRQGDVCVKRSMQHSFDQRTAKPTQNNFSLAYLDHARAPHGAGYEYAVLVQPTIEEIRHWQLQQACGQMPYDVLCRTRQAHVVRDQTLKATGYVFFEPGMLTVDAWIEGTTVPCLVMEREIHPQRRILSVADPDMRFYEGAADEQFDANGKRIERSIYSRSWISNPSAPSHPRLTLKGGWELVKPASYCRIIQSSSHQTIIEFDCVEGQSREVELRKR